MLDKETWKIGTDHGKMEKLIKQHMHFFFKYGFTPWKAEEWLRGMEIQEKEAQKD